MDDLTQTVGKVIDQLPQLGEHRSAVTTVFRLFGSYVLSIENQPKPEDRAMALEEIQVLLNWTPETVNEATQAVKTALENALFALQDQFAELTKTTVEDFRGFQARYEQEQAEQRALQDKAGLLLQAISDIAARFGIPNPDPALKVAPPAQETKRPNTLSAGLVGAMRLFVDVKPKPDASEQATHIPASWTTAPIFEADKDEDVRKIGIVQRRLTMNQDVAEVKKFLASLGLSDPQIVSLLTAIAEKARAQLTQSEEILANVGKDYEAISGSLQKILETGDINQAVRKYFLA